MNRFVRKIKERETQEIRKRKTREAEQATIQRLKMIERETREAEETAIQRLKEKLVTTGQFDLSKIDSSTIEPGTFVEVTYGRGERNPVSGEWKKLDTARGYIQAIYEDRLVIGERFWKKEIALARIQKLTIADSSREVGRSREMIGGAIATEYRSTWLFLGIAPGAVIFDEENFSISFVHVFAGHELGAGQFSASIEAGYGAPIEALEWGFGVFSVNGNFHLIKKHRLNTGVPFLSVGYTALVREGSTSLFNVGAGITWWSHKGRHLRLEVRDHIIWSGGESAHALEFRISVVR